MAGNLAKGLNDEVIELVLIGEIHKEYLERLLKKVESEVSRNVKVKTYTTLEEALDKELRMSTYLLLWSK